MRRSQSGQTATEYMLVISVIVIAVVAAAYVFVPTFRDGVRELGSDVSKILDSGQIGGVGEPRDMNTASGTGMRCTDQAKDMRFAAMFDPPKCIEDVDATPKADPMPSPKAPVVHDDSILAVAPVAQHKSDGTFASTGFESVTTELAIVPERRSRSTRRARRSRVR